MADPTAAVRKAVFDRLQAASVGAPVYNRAPDGTLPPYVLIEAVNLRGATSKSSTAWDVGFDILTVVAGRSFEPCEVIMANVLAALVGQALPHDSAELFSPRIEASDTEPDQERTWIVGRQSFRTVVQF